VSPLNTTQLYCNWITDNAIQNYHQCTDLNNQSKLHTFDCPRYLKSSFVKQTHFIDDLTSTKEIFVLFMLVCSSSVIKLSCLNNSKKRKETRSDGTKAGLGYLPNNWFVTIDLITHALKHTDVRRLCPNVCQHFLSWFQFRIDEPILDLVPYRQYTKTH
jgi:hypothetical protein